MNSWIPSKLFNSLRQTLNVDCVAPSAQTLIASWLFLKLDVCTAVAKTYGALVKVC